MHLFYLKASLLRKWLINCLLFLSACGQNHPDEELPAAQPLRAANPSGTLRSAPLATELEGLTNLQLYFGRYMVGYDEERYVAVFYKPSPASSWLKFPQVIGRQVTLDTASIDQAGEAELLLTNEYERVGNPDYGTVTTLYIIRMGPKPEILLTTLVSCEGYHNSPEEAHDLREVTKEQSVRAGYGFVTIGPIKRTCEASQPINSCDCDRQDIAEAGNPHFTQPGLYRWQPHGLARVGPPLSLPTHRRQE